MESHQNMDLALPAGHHGVEDSFSGRRVSIDQANIVEAELEKPNIPGPSPSPPSPPSTPSPTPALVLSGPSTPPPPVKKEATKAGSRKPRGKYKTKKQPAKLTKPKRALSAYNYFFRYERAKLLGCSPPPLTEELDEGETPGLYTVTKRRPHRKTHGQIGFTDLAKHIGQIWKQLDPKARSFYEELAAKDLKRYRKDLATYKQLVAATKGANGATPADTKKSPAKADKNSPPSIADIKMPPVCKSSSVSDKSSTVHSKKRAAAPHVPARLDPPMPVLSPMPVPSTTTSEQDEAAFAKAAQDTFPVLSAPDCDPLNLFGGPLEPLFSVEDTCPPMVLSSEEACPSMVTSSSMMVEDSCPPPMVTSAAHIPIEQTISHHHDATAAEEAARTDGGKAWGNFGDFDFASGDALVDYLCNLP